MITANHLSSFRLLLELNHWRSDIKDFKLMIKYGIEKKEEFSFSESVIRKNCLRKFQYGRRYYQNSVKISRLSAISTFFLLFYFVFEYSTMVQKERVPCLIISSNLFRNNKRTERKQRKIKFKREFIGLE